MPTPRDLLNEAKKSIREVDQADAQALLQGGGVTFLDVREPDEYEQGALPNAVHLPRGHLEFQVEGKLPDKSAPVVVYCAGGVRSAFATKTLGDLGYTDVQSMIGGFNKWKDDDRPWAAPQTLTPAQRNRYQRHLLLPEVGEVGQLKLLGVHAFEAHIGTVLPLGVSARDLHHAGRQINTDHITLGPHAGGNLEGVCARATSHLHDTLSLCQPGAGHNFGLRQGQLRPPK